MAKTQKKENVVFKKKKGFTQVQNWAPDDMTLSDKALGLYTRIQRWITFEAEGFECSKAFIRTKTPSGEKAFDSAWNELKERGYLKMYCQMFPRAAWTAELLDEPQPDTPHTYYINAQGEVTKTNVDMALLRENSRTPQKGGNGGKTRTPRFGGSGKGTSGNGTAGTGGNGNGSTGNGTTGDGVTENGGNIINTSPNTPFNTSSQTENQSINLSYKQASAEKRTDRVIDDVLISEIKEQIQFDRLEEDPNIDPADLAAVVDAIAMLKTTNVPQEFNGNTFSPEYVRLRSDMLTRDHIQYVFECFYQNAEKVYNVRRYLTVAVFNAPATMGAYYSNRARAEGIVSAAPPALR